ncbi:MAG: cytochrome c3 family protein [Anaerolineae bacterium]
MQRRLGCLAPQGLVAAGLTVVAIALVLLLWGGSLFSPGPLNAQAGAKALGGVRSHAEVGGRCSACHPAPWSGETLSDRCLACHVEVQDQLADPASLHGTLDDVGSVRPCYGCHGEHGGAEAALTRVSAESFPHQATGFSLQGHAETDAGDEFACADCHGQDLTSFELDTCGECHRDLDAIFLQAHAGAFGDGCLACHDGVDRYGAAYNHAEVAFALEGAHDATHCAACHSGARTPADLQSTPQDCYACHQEDDAHGGELGQDCAECHTPQDWIEVTFDHAQTQFPLDGAHLDVACGDCHQDAVFAGTPAECGACHEEPAYHAGLFDPDCAGCHDTVVWSPARFDRAHTFPFDHGEEGVSPCTMCHPDRLADYTCYECHEHQPAEIAAEHREEGITDFQDCVRCHPTGREEEGGREGGDD